MTRTVITEKHSVAKIFARVVGASSRKGESYFGYYFGRGWIVTWASGHLLSAVAPETDGKTAPEDLPVLPRSFTLVPGLKKGRDGRTVTNQDCVKQLDWIREAFDQADVIINAGDCGREGELIQRHILSYLGVRKKVMRFWASSLTDEAVRDALSHLHPSEEFDPLYQAARCRQDADWKVGINATRALRAASGIRTGYTLGRVKTVVLALVCRRYLEHESFVPEPYWTVRCTAVKDGTMVTFTSKTRWKSREEAMAAVTAASLGTLCVDGVETVARTAEPPLLYDLTTLQRDACPKLGLTAEETLETAQSLYLKQLITYPRTSSRHITESSFSHVRDLLATFSNHPQFGEAARALCSRELNRRSVDDTRVTDHEALMVTGRRPSDLTEREKAVYRLVATRMLEAFSPVCRYDATTVDASSGGVLFRATGSVIRDAGWKSVHGFSKAADDGDADDGDAAPSDRPIPSFSKWESLPGAEYSMAESQTKPKPLLTDASLLNLMEKAGEESEDGNVRESLKDCGIGTPATRAAIIGEVITAGYVERRGGKPGKLVPTELGLHVYGLVRNMDIADASLTGSWEYRLNAIASSRESTLAFECDIDDYTRRITKELLSLDIADKAAELAEKDSIRCPRCGNPMKVWPTNLMCRCCSLSVGNTHFGKKLTVSQMRALVEKGETAEMQGLTGRSGKTFGAKLRLVLPEDPSGRFARVEPVFGEGDRKGAPHRKRKSQAGRQGT